VPLRGIGTGRRKRELNADVNIINLVDVVLVLLLIFMLTAPMLQGGVDVRLPRAAAQPLEAREGLTITVTRDGDVAVGDTRMSLAEFEANLPVLIQNRQPDGVYLRGDEEATLGVMVKVMSAVRRSGITNLGIVVEPETRRP
jgi:biopolymer transport protein ExbD/biopolymer transport protein TolR